MPECLRAYVGRMLLPFPPTKNISAENTSSGSDAPSSPWSGRQAITLIEVMIVIVIIAILLTIAIPTIANERKKGWDVSAKSDVTNAYKAMKHTWASDGTYDDPQAISASISNEPSLHMVDTGDDYVQGQVHVTASGNTSIITTKSKSGVDFCLVAIEEGANAGVYRSWVAGEISGPITCPADTPAPTGGVVTQLTGSAGCWLDSSVTPIAGCGTISGFNSPAGVAVSPDGNNVYVAVLDVNGSNGSLKVFDRNSSTGVLTQKAGTAGCFAATGSGSCTAAKSIKRANFVAVSPDGKNVYVSSQWGAAASTQSGGVAVFDRDTGTGALTQKAGTAGCMSSRQAVESGCTSAAPLAGANAVTVSPDGKSVYVTSRAGRGPSSATGTGQGGVAIFDRNVTTGALTVPSGTNKCIVYLPVDAACATGVNVASPYYAEVSPDNKNVYITATGTQKGLAIFDRDTGTGYITQKAGAAGCVGTGGGCTAGTAISGPHQTAISPDGSSLYLSVNEGVALFDRDGSTGALTQKTGTDACVAGTLSGATASCASAIALEGAWGVRVSPDGNQLYVAATYNSSSHGALVIFDRSGSGTLTQKSGTDGCISDSGTGGSCTTGTAINGFTFIDISADNKNIYGTAGVSNTSPAASQSLTAFGIN